MLNRLISLLVITLLAYIVVTVTITEWYVMRINIPDKPIPDYYLNVDNSGYKIYTEDWKLIGELEYGVNRTLDSLIDADNK